MALSGPGGSSFPAPGLDGRTGGRGAVVAALSAALAYFLSPSACFLIDVPSACAADVSGYRALGSISSRLSAPTGVATDFRERIIVTESSSNRFLVFGADGRFLAQRTGLAKPTGVAAAPDGGIFVGNAGRGCVDVYDGNLKFVRNLGRGSGEFSLPLGIAVDARGVAYVADGKEDRVKVYDRVGALLFSFGGTGDGDGRFRFPTAIACDDVSGEVVVADLPATAQGAQGARIQVFSRDGVFKRRFASFGLGEGLLVKPLGLAVDGAGRIFVTDAYQNVVQVFDAGGAFLFVIHDRSYPLRTPLGVAVGPRSGKLYVASLNTSNVVVYGTGDGSGDTGGGSGGATLTFESRGGSCSVGGTSASRASSYGTALHLLLPVLLLLLRRRRDDAGKQTPYGGLERR